MTVTRERRRTACVQPLEQRRLLAAGAAISGGVLIVVGTDRNDVIELVRDSAKKKTITRVMINGQAFKFNQSNYTSVAVYGDDGNDRIVDRGNWKTLGAVGQLSIYGEGGNDRIDAYSNFGRLYGGSGNDSLVNTGSGRMILSGSKGNDTLYGGSSNDTLFGGSGADLLDGRAGSRDLVTNGDPSDTTIRGNSRDYGLRFGAPVAISLDDVANDGTPGERDNIRSVELFVASFGNDTLDFRDADYGVEILDGFNAGADSIIGSPYNDVLITRYEGSGPAPDRPGVTIRGSDGNDYIRGGAGRDVLYGEGGNDEIDDFDDRDDLIDAGSGNDSIDDSGGDDTLIGGAGNDTINNGGDASFRDEIRGSSGTDILFAAADDEDDIITGIETFNVLS